MPQHCLGLEDPAGGAPRPCVFAADGRGGPCRVEVRRDGPRCSFCCPRAFERAVNSRVGMGHMTKRLKGWFEDGSPSYEAAFTFGIPGLLLSDSDQRGLRRRAGELPYFNPATSWLHRKISRLEALLYGKPIPKAPSLSPAGQQFLAQCQSRQGKTSGCVKIFRRQIRRYVKYRGKEPSAGKGIRRAWWRLRRELQQQLCKHLRPLATAGPPFSTAVTWAMDEGFCGIRSHVAPLN